MSFIPVPSSTMSYARSFDSSNSSSSDKRIKLELPTGPKISETESDTDGKLMMMVDDLECKKRIDPDSPLPVPMSSTQKNGSDLEKSKEFSTDTDVLTDDILMPKILHLLNRKDLKSCRLVSPKWNSLVLTEFEENTKNGLSITAYYTSHSTNINEYDIDKNFHRIHLIHGNVTSLKRLEDLTCFLFMQRIKSTVTHPEFPIFDFTFRGGTLEHSDIQEFLDEHGRQIKKLRLDVYSEFVRSLSLQFPAAAPPALDNVKKLLTVQAPNLVHLELMFIPELRMAGGRATRRFLSENKLKLPALKTLHLGPTCPVWLFDELVKAAVNLEDLHLRKGNLGFYFGIPRFDLLKCLYFLPVPPEEYTPISMEEHLDILDALSVEDEVQLREFHMLRMYQAESQHWPRIGQIISQFLYNHRETLEKVTWQPLDFLSPFLHQTIFTNTCLPSVRHLTLKEDMYHPKPSTRSSRLFPQELKVSDLFPNLTTVVIELGKRYGDLEGLSAGCMYIETDPLVTVKHLTIVIGDLGYYAAPSLLEMIHLSSIFPNVLSVRFENIWRVDEGCFGIWAFTSLKELHLSFNMGNALRNKCRKKGCSLDPFFTGIGEEDCERLKYKRLGVLDDIQGAVKLRKTFSILDLPELKYLTLTFFDESAKNMNERVHDSIDYELPEPMSLTISSVSGRFGFGICPGLVTDVCIEAEGVHRVEKWKEYLLVLLPYVRSGPWKKN